MATLQGHGRRDAHVRPSLVPDFVYGSVSAVLRILHFGRGAGARTRYDFPDRLIVANCK